MSMMLGNGVEDYFLLLRMTFFKRGYFLVCRLLRVEDIYSGKPDTSCGGVLGPADAESPCKDSEDESGVSALLWVSLTQRVPGTWVSLTCNFINNRQKGEDRDESYFAHFNNSCENRNTFSVIKRSEISCKKSTRKEFCEGEWLDSLLFIFFKQSFKHEK